MGDVNTIDPKNTIKPQEIKVISNRPKPQDLLSPFFLYENVMKKINDDKSLFKIFPETSKEYASLKEQTKGAQCSSCEINKKGKLLMETFVKEMKSSSAEEQVAVISLLGRNLIVPINQNWVNLSTNETVPFEFRSVTVNAPTPLPVKSDNKKETVETKPSPMYLVKNDVKKRKIIFQNFQGPGDIVMMTAGIRDLFLKYKEEKTEIPFIIDVRTSSMNIWEGNPYVEWGKGTPLDEKASDVEVIRLGYPLIHQSNQGPYHFTEAFTEEIEDKLNIRIKRRLRKGDIHIRKEEEVWGWTERATWFKEYGVDPNAEYWIIDAGHKMDFTAKFWGKNKFQKVVDHYKGKIQFVQIGYESPNMLLFKLWKKYGGNNHAEFLSSLKEYDLRKLMSGNLISEKDKIYLITEFGKTILSATEPPFDNHVHYDMDGVINLVGKTDDRQLIRLIWASSGVLTPVSLPMVLAAAVPVKQGTCKGRLERPCVVISGGREPSGWQAYTNHQYIHTCGALPCCDRGGCWTSRTKPIGDGDDKDRKNMCHNVTIDEYGEEVPYCMHMITVEDVIRRIDMYHQFYSENKEKYTYNKKDEDK